MRILRSEGIEKGMFFVRFPAGFPTVRGTPNGHTTCSGNYCHSLTQQTLLLHTRLRHQFRIAVREQVAATLQDPDEDSIIEEMEQLQRSLVQ